MRPRWTRANYRCRDPARRGGQSVATRCAHSRTAAPALTAGLRPRSHSQAEYETSNPANARVWSTSDMLRVQPQRARLAASYHLRRGSANNRSLETSDARGLRLPISPVAEPCASSTSVRVREPHASGRGIWHSLSPSPSRLYPPSVVSSGVRPRAARAFYLYACDPSPSHRRLPSRYWLCAARDLDPVVGAARAAQVVASL